MHKSSPAAPDPARISELRARYDAVARQRDLAAAASDRDPGDITIIPVSKAKQLATLRAAIAAGIRVFGENYAQEMQEKYLALDAEGLARDCEWHFIGHLQRNKVKYIAPFVNWIHSVDSIALAAEISKRALALNRRINILLQVNSSGEESKFGCAPGEVKELAAAALDMPGMRLQGLMTIAAYADSADAVRPMFALMRSLREQLRSTFAPRCEFPQLSMGMSGDFATAIAEGATMIRIGTAIFWCARFSKMM